MRHPSRLDLIEGLNDDLARAYARVIQGRTFGSVVRGTDRLALRPLFARQIAYGISHAATLADAIVALDVARPRATPHHRVGSVAANPSDRAPQTAMVGVTWPDEYRDAGSC